MLSKRLLTFSRRTIEFSYWLLDVKRVRSYTTNILNTARKNVQRFEEALEYGSDAALVEITVNQIESAICIRQGFERPHCPETPVQGDEGLHESDNDRPPYVRQLSVDTHLLAPSCIVLMPLLVHRSFRWNGKRISISIMRYTLQ